MLRLVVHTVSAGL